MNTIVKFSKWWLEKLDIVCYVLLAISAVFFCFGFGNCIMHSLFFAMIVSLFSGLIIFTYEYNKMDV